MKIGCTSLGMKGTPLPQAIEKMRRFGVECTELNGRPGCHPDITWESQADYQTARQLFAGAGIVATSLGGYCDFAQFDDKAMEEQIEGFVGYCQRAVQLGIPIVRAFAGDVREGYTLADFEKQIIGAFVELIKRVKDLDIQIGIENHGKLANDGFFLRKLIETVASPKLGMTIDTGNFYWAGHPPETVDAYIKLLAPYTVSLHIKDVVCRDGEVAFVPAGRGIVDLPRLLTLLQGNGFDGPIVSEYEGGDAYESGTMQSVAYLRGLRDGMK